MKMTYILNQNWKRTITIAFLVNENWLKQILCKLGQW